VQTAGARRSDAALFSIVKPTRMQQHPSALPHSLDQDYPAATSLSHSDIFSGKAQMRAWDKEMSF
jgi:hypothetical protein